MSSHTIRSHGSIPWLRKLSYISSSSEQQLRIKSTEDPSHQLQQTGIRLKLRHSKNRKMYSATSLLFLALIIPTLASLTPVSTTQSTILSFGAAHKTHTYILDAPSETITSITVETPTKTSKPILSRYETNHVDLGNGMFNITVDLFFESWVGNFDYAVLVKTLQQGFENTYAHADSHAVYGMVFYRSNSIVSGDEQEGLKFPHYLTPDSEAETLDVMINAPEGVDMTPVLTARDTLSKGSELLPRGSMILSNGRLTIRPTAFTTGGAVIDVICPGLEIDGEVFETVIEVSVSSKPPAPVVLISANGSYRDGEATIYAFLRNGDDGVVMLINGTELHGENKNGRYVFHGKIKPGLYEHVGIRNSNGDGVVNRRLVVEVLDVNNKIAAEPKGKKAPVAIIVIMVIVAAVVTTMVAIALIIYKRSQKADEQFVDGRVEHIVRDAYGRGSVQV